MGGLVEEVLLADGDGGGDLGSDSVLKLGTFWLISRSGNGLVELVKHGAATKGEDKVEIVDTDEVFVEVVEVMIFSSGWWLVICNL